jgi:hypothetical protein
MITTTVASVIERRLLVNYRIKPGFVAPLLPEPFRPQLVSGYAVGGVCFIRLGRIRPPHIPRALGITTENVAHRFAVEWDDADGGHVGVYVPRRDTNSRVTSLAGGRVFPGSYRLARFNVREPGDEVRIRVFSHDGQVRLAVEAVPAGELPSELFGTLDEAVGFFRHGALGFSPSGRGGCLDTVRLESTRWAARPMKVNRMTSSLFDDPAVFPPGTCVVDSALVMRNLPVQWVTELPPATDPRGRAA